MPSPIKIPKGLLILDGFGAMLAGVGMAKIVANVDLLPLHNIFPQYGFVLIGLGIACIAPLPIHLVRRAINANQNPQQDKPAAQKRSSVFIE